MRASTVLAQRKGAKAVVATLWPVVDASTSVLMRRFYEQGLLYDPREEGGERPRRVDIGGLPVETGHAFGQCHDVLPGARSNFERRAGGRGMRCHQIADRRGGCQEASGLPPQVQTTQSDRGNLGSRQSPPSGSAGR